MSALIYDTVTQAFKDADTPKIWGGQSFVDADGKVYDNGVWKDAWSSVEIVPFSTGTDAQIKAMLDAYYADKITWQEMGWAVGDTRVIHFNEMDAPSPQAPGSKWSAQDITIVIVAHDHNDLATPINGHTKACITVQTREVMNDNADYRDCPGDIYMWGANAVATTFVKWANIYTRTYLNNTVFAALPSGDFKNAIKPSTHYRHTDYNTSDAELVTDTLFLPSIPEYAATLESAYYVPTSPVEGTAFPYYQISANRVKYGNNNGVSNGIAQWHWTGSASAHYHSGYGYHWCMILNDGTPTIMHGIRSLALSPAWVM